MINFRGSTGYGQKVIDAINGDWGGAPFEDLMKGLDYAEQQYPFIDKDRECALGASYGGGQGELSLAPTKSLQRPVSHPNTVNPPADGGANEAARVSEWGG